MGAERHKQIFKAHGGMWKEMSEARQSLYDRRAVPYRKQQEAQLFAMCGQLRAEIAEAEEALQAEKNNDLPLGLKSCHLNESDLEQWDVLLTDPMFSGKALDTLQKSRLHAPPQISPALQTLLSDQVLFDPDDFFSLPKPAWLASVCDYRDHMQGAALCFWTGGEKHWFLFLYAMQSPQLAVFCPLTLESEYTLLPQCLSSPSADLERPCGNISSALMSPTL